MSALHSSPHQRKMIAEINAPFHPKLVTLDAIDVCVDGGPMTGKRANGDVFLASADRVAIDAIGVAILKALGSNPATMTPKIIDHEAIAIGPKLGTFTLAEHLRDLPSDPVIVTGHGLKLEY